MLVQFNSLKPRLGVHTTLLADILLTIANELYNTTKNHWAHHSPLEIIITLE